MAKAKKPTSGSKSATQAQKSGESATGGSTSKAAGAEKAESVAPSKAAQASAAKVEKTVSKPAAEEATPPKSAASLAAKTVEKSKSETADAKTKTPEADKPNAGTDAKPDVAAKDAGKPAVHKLAEPAPQPKPEKQRSVFWPLVIGGVVAGGIGFAVSELNLLGKPGVDVSQIEKDLATQQDRIASLEGAEPAAPDLSGLEASIAGLSETVSAFEARLAELENRPVVVGDGSGPSPEYAQELAALQASVEEQKNEIGRLLENALSVEEATAQAAQAAAVQSALAKITAALGSGSGYADAIDDLTASGVENVPEALVATASDGAPTLLNLQAGFPATARAALSSARAAGADDGNTGFGGFLKRQLGARSVAPREGSDPDAVLSRAEAAVRDGRIAEALAEIDGLPTAAQEAMADWLASARARAGAEAAVQELSQRLTAN